MFGRKNYGNYGQSESKIGKKLVLFLVLVAALALGYFQFIKMYESQARAAVAATSFDVARQKFERIASLPFNKGRGEHGLGIIALLTGDTTAAETHFAKVLTQKPINLGSTPSMTFWLLFENGRYRDAAIYRDFLQKWVPEGALKNLSLDFATISLAMRQPDQADAWLKKASPKAQKDPRYSKLTKMHREMVDNQEAPILLDRNGKPILVWQLDNQAYAFTSERLFAGWNSNKGPIIDNLDEAELFHQINTTLDLNLQKAAFQAMKGYQGTLIIANPTDGEILAAYGTADHPPFSTTFEPGSVIKVVTYGAFLEHDGDTSPYAPKNYPGNMEIGGKIFYDWTTQGRLETVNQGMAVSCNLMFAQMGNALGWSRWNRGVKKYFDGEHRDGLIAPAIMGNLVAEPDGAYELGRAAIGLDFLETSVLGLVQIPMAIGNNGKLAAPRLIKNHVNIEGQVCKVIPQMRTKEIYTSAIASELMGSLVESVTFQNGTARRAGVDFVETGMKTGTAGERPFDSIMIGLAPAPQANLAFALYLDKGGKCEINGAKVAKSLLEQIRALAPEYLERKK